ncbi:Meiotic recombination protein DMC1/LIM15 -like protein, partial [Toxocara canis]
ARSGAVGAVGEIGELAAGVEVRGCVDWLTLTVKVLKITVMQNAEQVVPGEETETTLVDDFEDELNFYQDVELLQSHGINVADIKKLQGVGICTIKGIMMTTKKRLCDVRGLSEAKVDKIKEIAAKLTV